jgi:dihydroxy-acid dehydratase
MLCLASCDKTTPGQLMAAARIDVPTVIVACGYQPCGVLDNGERVDIEEVFIQAGHVATGRTTLRELCDMSDRAIQGPGVCTGMGTANSMHIMAEALGMTIAGSTPVRANSEKMWQTVREAGAAIVAAVEADRRPRSILTEDALRNAARTLLAVSGSINCIKHLQAIAREGEVDIDILAEVELAGRIVRPLAAVRPNGSDTIEDFEDAGGARAVLRRLAPVLNTAVVTVTGETLAERIADVPPAPAGSTIRTLDDPAADFPTIMIVRGSLAPDGAIVKLAVTERRQLSLTGSARVFESAPDAIAAITAGRVVEGDVLVLRGLGPRGTPGMGMASNVVFTLDGAGLTGRVAVVTDGQLSGLVNKGIVLGEVRPEGATGGPLGLVEDGDRIDIDVVAGRADLLVDEDVLALRRAARVTDDSLPAGWLGLYASAAEPLAQGATLRPRP